MEGMRDLASSNKHFLSVELKALEKSTRRRKRESGGNVESFKRLTTEWTMASQPWGIPTPT